MLLLKISKSRLDGFFMISITNDDTDCDDVFISLKDEKNETVMKAPLNIIFKTVDAFIYGVVMINNKFRFIQSDKNFCIEFHDGEKSIISTYECIIVGKEVKLNEWYHVG